MHVRVYCAIIFQIVNYWDSGTVKWQDFYQDARVVLIDSVKLTFTAPDYGLEVITWGASRKTCEEMPASEQLTVLRYFVDFDGDGKVCNE